MVESDEIIAVVVSWGGSCILYYSHIVLFSYTTNCTSITARSSITAKNIEQMQVMVV